jgi:putative membrane protein
MPMKIRARDFFSKEEKQQIRRGVEAAEKHTHGEIAIAVLDASDSYREAEILGALLFSALFALVLAMLLGRTTVWFHIPVTAVLFFPCLYLFRVFPHMKLAFTSHRRVEEAVRERAVYTFFRRGVHKTSEETGILIFISLLERKVWILADKGIHEKIPSDFWRNRTRELTTGIREGRAFEALQDVIEKCGAELTKYYPCRRERTNQLDDDVIC